MANPVPDQRLARGPAARPAWLRRRRPLIGVGVAALVLAVVAVALLDGGGSPSIAGSPALPSTYRPGIAIGPVSLGETRAAVLAALAAPGRQLVPGTLVFARPGGQLAVGFTGGRVSGLLATGGGNPFGQRLAAEETSLPSWNVSFCEKPAHVLLVAPGGHTYFVFPNAAAGLGAVGISAAPVTACGPLA
jgi:hypothetical protein